MTRAFSRLKFILEERGWSRSDLLRRLGAQDRGINPKTIYRLADPDIALERLDLRVAGIVCEELGVGLNDLVAFADGPDPLLRRLSDDKPLRLDELMEKHGEGQLPSEELAELRALVDEATEITADNARRLAAHQRRIRDAMAESRSGI